MQKLDSPTTASIIRSVRDEHVSSDIEEGWQMACDYVLELIGKVPQDTTPISEAAIEAGAHALAERFFLCGTQQKMSYFPPSQQRDFREKARAVLEAARAVTAQ